MLRRSSLWAFAALALAGLAGQQSASGAIVYFPDEAPFLAALQPGYYTETFDGLPLGFADSPLSFAGNGFSYDASAPNGFFQLDGGAGDVWLSTDTPFDPIVFNFTSGNVTGVGGFFFLTDFDGAVVPGSFEVLLSDGTFGTATNFTSGTFLGFTTDPGVFITSLIITPIDGVGIDVFATANNLTVGAVVPEPAALSLCLVGALGLAAARTARRRLRLA